MRTQVQPKNEHVSCSVCHRTMLKGERAEPYLTPSRERRLVCSLCAPRAQREGWIREAAAPETPTRPARNSDRRGLRRLRRRRKEPTAGEQEQELEPIEPQFETEQEPDPEPERPVVPSSPRDPRHVQAVPTNLQLKLDRAIEVFNESEHRRTIAGLARTLGPPSVSALNSASSAAEVVLTIGWELAWYQYAVDLSDQREPVQLRARGEELDELPAEAKHWNARTGEDGALLLGQQADAPA